MIRSTGGYAPSLAVGNQPADGRLLEQEPDPERIRDLRLRDFSAERRVTVNGNEASTVFLTTEHGRGQH